MHRRSLLALPLLAAMPFPSSQDWRRDISEIRFGTTAPSANPYSAILRTTVHAVQLPQAALIQAFTEGQLEFAECTQAQADAIQAALGPRLLRQGNACILRSLPAGLRADLIEALQQA